MEALEDSALSQSPAPVEEEVEERVAVLMSPEGDIDERLLKAVDAVMEEKGVTHLAAICAICKSQFTKVLPYYGFTMDQIVSVHQLVSNAIILEGQVDPED